MNALKKKLKEAQNKVESMAHEKSQTPAATTTPAAAGPAPASTTTTADAPTPAAAPPTASTEQTTAAGPSAAGGVPTEGAPENPDIPQASDPKSAETFPAAVDAPAAKAAAPLPEEDEPTHVETRGNGTVIKEYADGRKVTIYPDGRVVNEFADGSSTTTFPDGRTTHYTPVNKKQDPLDKALQFGARRLGFNLSNDTTDKITSKGREAYEKKTGKKVSAKLSN